MKISFFLILSLLISVLISCQADVIIGNEDNSFSDISFIPQQSHSSSINSFTLSKDNKYLASASWDRTIKIWEYETGLKIEDLENGDFGVLAISFSPNDDFLVALDQGGVINVWETNSWTIYKSLSVGGLITSAITEIRSFGFFEDQFVLQLREGQQNITFRWNKDTWKAIGTVDKREIVFSQNYKYQAILSDSMIQLEGEGIDRKIESFKVDAIIAISNNGKRLLCHIGGKTTIVNVSGSSMVLGDSIFARYRTTGNIDTIAAVNSRTNEIMIWEVESGRSIYSFIESSFSKYELSPDGRFLAIKKESRAIEFHDVLNGQKVFEAPLPRMIGGLGPLKNDIYFNSDSKSVICPGPEHSIQIWKPECGELERIFGFWDGNVKPSIASFINDEVVPDLLEITGVLKLSYSQISPSFSPFQDISLEPILATSANFRNDPRKRARHNTDGTLFAEFHQFRYDSINFYRSDGPGFSFDNFERDTTLFGMFRHFTPSSDRLILHNKNFIEVYETKPSIVLQTRIKKKDDFWLSHNWKHIIVLNGRTYEIYNLQNGELQYKVESKLTGRLKFANVSPGSTFLYECLGLGNDTVTVITNLETLDTVQFRKKYDRSFLRFNPLDNWLVETQTNTLRSMNSTTFNEESAVIAYNLSNLNEKHELSNSEDIEYTLFNNSSSHLIGKTYSTTIKIWDSNDSFKFRRELNHHTQIESVVPLNDSIVTSMCSDGSIYLWNIMNGRNLLKWFNFGDDFILINDSLNYMASKGAFQNLVMKIGKDPFKINQFDLQFNKPHKVLNKLGADKNIVQLLQKAYNKRLVRNNRNSIPSEVNPFLHKPEIVLQNKYDFCEVLQKDSVNLHFKLNGNGVNLAKVFASVNGVPILGVNGKVLPERVEDDFTLVVDLASGDNLVEVYVEDERGIPSLPYQQNFVSQVSKPPTLFLISIGVANYKESEMNLTYSNRDAWDIGYLFHEAFGYADICMSILTDEKATRENILSLKDVVSKADVNDYLVFFYSGHGYLDSVDLEYYVSPYDMKFDFPSQSGVSFSDIEDIMASSRARQKLVLLDACHSGEVDKETLSEISSKLPNSVIPKSIKGAKGITPIKEGKKQQSSFIIMQELFSNFYEGSGSTIISSSAGLEFSIEDETWQNGVFTYSLKSAFYDNLADLNGDGLVVTSELSEFLKMDVSFLTSGFQSPNSRFDNTKNDFILWQTSLQP
ncbi:MAG: caspase family protein [bacterium]|nr:caspase family protein [bacterium]